MKNNTEFTTALKKESNKDARELLDCFYYSLMRAGSIYSYKRMDYEESPEQKAFQHLGADLLVQKRKHEYQLYEEKVTFVSDLYFELKTYSYSQKRYVDGWLTSPYKKTDTLVYYMQDVGIYVFNFDKIKQWILQHEKEFLHLESNDSKPNQLVRVTQEQLKQAPHSFIDWEELQLIKRIHCDKLDKITYGKE